jgi:hypothetical protein
MHTEAVLCAAAAFMTWTFPSCGSEEAWGKKGKGRKRDSPHKV